MLNIYNKGYIYRNLFQERRNSNQLAMGLTHFCKNFKQISTSCNLNFLLKKEKFKNLANFIFPCK
jgi:hypothetical protein